MDHIRPLLSTSLFFLVIVCVTYYPIWKIRHSRRYSPFVENRLRLPGESVRSALSDLLANIAAHYVILTVAILFVHFSLFFFDYSGTGAILTAVAGFIIFCFLACRINRVFRAAINHRVGVQGEEYTGQELNLLARTGAFVFHDIPYHYGNIDHVVVGYDKIFVVETKAVRKPAGSDGKKEGQVEYDGKQLKFPHYTTDAPLKQAQCHADCLARILRKDRKCSIPVIPVVALPGWFVKSNSDSASGVLVMNPRRGRFLHKLIGERRKCDQFDSAVIKIEKLARLDSPLPSITDPDAAEHYNLWTNEPKVKGSR